MAKRTNVGSGTPWEEVVGYSRAVRAGDAIVVAGTTATDEAGRVVAPGDAYRQARHALEKVLRAVEAAGGRREQVVRTRFFVTDIGRWREFGRAHQELLGDVRPATTMVQVARLVDPAMLVEIEAEARL